MDNKKFDDIIKKKLDQLNPSDADGAWDLFKEKWENQTTKEALDDSQSSSDEALDEKIKRDMQGLRMPFNSRHWIILKDKLLAEALFKKKLFVAKSMELIILALLVIGVLNLWPIQKDIYQIPIYDIPMVASIPVNKATAEEFNLREQKNKIQSKNFRIELTKITEDLIEKTFARENVEILEIHTIKSGKLAQKNYKAILAKAINPDPNGIIDLSIFPFLETDGFFDFKNSLDNSRALILTNTLDPKDNALLELPQRPLGFPDIVLQGDSEQKKGRTFASIAIGPKVNLVNSPFDPVYGFDPYNTFNTNFNITAKIQKELGPVELYAGLGYTNTSYQPLIIKEKYEPKESVIRETSLDNIEFKTFNVPLGVKYNIINKPTYQFYAAAGVDLNLIADSDYEIVDGLPESRFNPAPVPSTKNTPDINAKLSQKEFNHGIFSGGSIRDNLYATASFGLGFNKSISSRTGIFIEPRYSHFISSNGIGPNSDKVHGLSIDLGVRYELD